MRSTGDAFIVGDAFPGYATPVSVLSSLLRKGCKRAVLLIRGPDECARDARAYEGAFIGPASPRESVSIGSVGKWLLATDQEEWKRQFLGILGESAVLVLNDAQDESFRVALAHSLTAFLGIHSFTESEVRQMLEGWRSERQRTY